MTILPLTRRGAWLTAATIWFAGCAWVWWMLPAVTRAERPFGQRPGLPEILPVGPTFVDRSMRDPATPDWLLWNTETNSVKSVPELADRLRVHFSPDGRWVAFTFQDPFINVYDAETGTTQRIALADGRPQGSNVQVEFSPDSQTLAVTDAVGATPGVKLYDLPPGESVRVLHGSMWFSGFSADGRRIACSLGSEAEPGREENMGVWSVADGRRLGTIKGRIRYLIDVTPDATQAIVEHQMMGRMIPLSPGVKRTYAAYECIDRNGREIWSTGHGFAGRLLDGGRRLALAEWPADPTVNGPLRIVFRDTADGQVLRTCELSPDVDVVAAIAPDGRTAAVVGTAHGGPPVVNRWLQRWGIPWAIPWSDRMLWTVDLTTGCESAYLQAEPERVEFSADGRSLAVVDSGYACRVWDVPPRKPLSWLAAGAATWAAPLALLACWRVRRIASRAAA